MTGSRAFFSFPSVTDADHHADYNAWHQLDHRPENLALPGVLHGDRWVRTPDCVAASTLSDPRLATSQYVAMYWFAEPVSASVAAWKELGDTTLQQGRRPDLLWTTRPLMGLFRPIKGYLNPLVPISLNAMPFRPHRGVYVSVTGVAQPHSAAAQRLFHFHDTVRIPSLVAMPGVIGGWTFISESSYQEPAGQKKTEADWPSLRITLLYLDREPVTYANEVAENERSGLLISVPADLADCEELLVQGPLETIEPHRWDWFE